jgi:hypothetical protein
MEGSVTRSTPDVEVSELTKKPPDTTKIFPILTTNTSHEAGITAVPIGLETTPVTRLEEIFDKPLIDPDTVRFPPTASAPTTSS